MKISIIVPIYNKEKYLKKCIETLLNQTEKEIEIILINDGSNDNSEKICLEYILKKNVLYKKIKNSGVSKARNEGIKIATGDYLVFIDSDDFIDLEMLRNLYNEIKRENSDIIICGMKEFVDGKIARKIKLEDKCFKLDKDSYNNILDIDPILFHSCGNKLFKRDIVIKNNLNFLETSHSYEDLNFVLKYLTFTNKVSIVKECYYNYFRNMESVTKKKQNYETPKELYLKLKEECDTFLDIKKFLTTNKNKFIENIFLDKIKNINLREKNIKYMQNLYIKNKTLNYKEIVLYCQKLEEIYQGLYKNERNMYLRMFIFRVFRTPLNYMYRFKEKKC